MSDGIVPLTPVQVQQQETQAAGEGYVKRALIAVDDLGNVLTGGMPDETISARAARDAVKHEVVGEIVSKTLDILQRDHGAKAIAGDEERAAAVAKVEDATGILEQ
jgi:hypothetical protein